MKKSGVLALFVMLVAGLFVFTSCDQTTSTELEESFQKVKEVTPIPGAQNVTMDLAYGDTKGEDSYFVVDLGNGNSKEGWCVEWNEASIQGVQSGTKMYSTKGQEAWKELNYFMAIKDDLRAKDPDLTYKEIQVVIWSLIDNPAFDVDKISTYENISERIYKDGQALFNVQKVKEIVSQVNSYFTNIKLKGDDDYEPLPGVTFIQNDGQTIMLGGETAFAYNANYSTCFEEEIIEDISFPRWGWTNGGASDNNNYAKAITEGDTYEFDIYAGAGQCDLTKGTRVGKLFVDYFDGLITVKYEMDVISEFTGELYTMTKTHLYIGSEPYPINSGSGKYTVAPGQYGNQTSHDHVTEFTYPAIDVSELSNVYIIAHADVYGFVPPSTE